MQIRYHLNQVWLNVFFWINTQEENMKKIKAQTKKHWCLWSVYVASTVSLFLAFTWHAKNCVVFWLQNLLLL